jgi:NAD+ synthase (glutamine-hydrolysing)
MALNAIIRIMTAVNRVSPGSPAACGESLRSLVADIEASAADLVVFPSLALSSPSLGNFYQNQVFLDAALEQLDLLRVSTSHLPCYILVGLPLWDGGGPMSAIAVLYKGERLGFLAADDPPEALRRTAFSEEILPPDTVFRCGELHFVVLAGDPLQLPVRVGNLVHTGFDLIVAPSYQPAKAGYFDAVCDVLRTTSLSFGCGIAAVNGGLGDTSFPYAYRGFGAVYECGQRLVAQQVEDEPLVLVCDMDSDIIARRRRLSHYKAPLHTMLPQTRKHGLLRPISPDPFLPEDGAQRARYLTELFELQCRSLEARLVNTGIKKMVVGVSGGLDSTLALLVCAATADRMGIPRRHIIALTLPGLGTSDRTYQNALALIEALGCEGRDISIRKAVLNHFTDIGHDPQNRDVTYENAQARERTQVLLDVANMVGGLMVGGGDLSEDALGFSTFGGDHISGYNVNICLTKGMVRAMITLLSETEDMAHCRSLLQDILNTPVSPELLPGQGGAIVQKTEDILGPYALHDFFLYNLVHNGYRPSKLFYYACIAFSGRYEPRYIKEKLVLFIKKFCAGQFKRSGAPDGAAITEVHLLGCDFYMPSDMTAEALLADIEGIDF